MKSEFLDFDFSSLRQQSLPAFVRSVGHFRLLQRHEASCRYVENFGELFWCIEGKGYFDYAGRRRILHPGEVWYYPPRSHHQFGPVDGLFHYRWLSLEGPNADLLFRTAGILPGCRYGGNCPEELFAKIELQIRHSDRKSSLEMLAIAFSILCRAASGVRKKQEWLDETRHIMEENYASPTFNFQRLADILHVSRVVLSRRFSQKYGVSVSDYLRNIRVQNGLKMLKESQMSLADIALASGFSSPSYFCKVVHRLTGMKTTFHRLPFAGH